MYNSTNWTSLNWPSTTACALNAGAGFWTTGANEGEEEDMKDEGEVEKEEVTVVVMAEFRRIFGAMRRSAMALRLAAIFFALKN